RRVRTSETDDLVERPQRRPLGVAGEGFFDRAAPGPVLLTVDRHRVRWAAREDIGMSTPVREIETRVGLVVVQRALGPEAVPTQGLGLGAVDELAEPLEGDGILGVDDVPALLPMASWGTVAMQHVPRDDLARRPQVVARRERAHRQAELLAPVVVIRVLRDVLVPAPERENEAAGNEAVAARQFPVARPEVEPRGPPH